VYYNKIQSIVITLPGVHMLCP